VDFPIPRPLVRKPFCLLVKYLFCSLYFTTLPSSVTGANLEFCPYWSHGCAHFVVYYDEARRTYLHVLLRRSSAEMRRSLVRISSSTACRLSEQRFDGLSQYACGQLSAVASPPLAGDSLDLAMQLAARRTNTTKRTLIGYTIISKHPNEMSALHLIKTYCLPSLLSAPERL